MKLELIADGKGGWTFKFELSLLSLTPLLGLFS
jgi:hypothetical protein